MIYLSLHSHQQNDSCINVGSDESHFNVSSLIVRDKHKTVSTNHNFKRERRAEADSNRGPSAYQPNALPLGQTGSHETVREWSRHLIVPYSHNGLTSAFTVALAEPRATGNHSRLWSTAAFEQTMVHCCLRADYGPLLPSSRLWSTAAFEQTMVHCCLRANYGPLLPLSRLWSTAAASEQTMVHCCLRADSGPLLPLSRLWSTAAFAKLAESPHSVTVSCTVHEQTQSLLWRNQCSENGHYQYYHTVRRTTNVTQIGLL